MVFLSRELARLGHRVEVYNECADGDLGLDAHGVRWLRHATYDSTTPPDVFVAWRYHISTALAGAGPYPKKYAWLQDVPGYDSWTPDFVEGLSGIFTLSKFHTRTLPAHARYRARETPNGIDLSFIVEGDNRWDVFAYGSAPNRGLYDVLRIWPAVRERLPNATLVVYPLAAPNIFRLHGIHPRRRRDSVFADTTRATSRVLSQVLRVLRGGRQVGPRPRAALRRVAGGGRAAPPTAGRRVRGHGRPRGGRAARTLFASVLLSIDRLGRSTSSRARGVAAIIRPRRPAGPHHPVSSSS